MSSSNPLSIPSIHSRIQNVQILTIAWMVVEAGISGFAALRAHSPALLAFGGDSAIELLSAAVVLWRFQATARHSNLEKRSAQIAGGLLFALAAFVVLSATLAFRGSIEPRPSYLGIAVLLAASLFMPLLAREKHRLSTATKSATLRADAVQSALCSYLSAVTLLGLLINSMFHVNWADPLAAVAAVPIIVYEGGKAMRGVPCACH